MSEVIEALGKQHVTRTGERKVRCDGPIFSKHPVVYLTMVDDAQGRPERVVCPYCSHVFEFDEALAVVGAH